MISEAREQIKQNDKDITSHYEMQLYNTLKKLLGKNVDLPSYNVEQLIENTKKRYGIKNQLEAIKQTLHNLDDVLIIFDTEIKEARDRRW